MEYITKSSISRLAKRAGIKNLSEDSYQAINKIIEKDVKDLVKILLIANCENNNKTININDIYNCFSIKGYNVSYSDDINTSTYIK
jgi:histone H3/H4